ncbi:MAG: hydroxyacid dehydrogenase [Thalassobaculum sp.]|uniref:hydroxyacid dehydrogenase n=1 Tax=Thalassobaculum sp. TaxID=2022740 RepID=UPI0032EACE0D
MRPKAAMFHDYPPGDGDVFGAGRRERIAELTDLYPAVVTAADFDRHAAALAEVEVIFATWGMIRFEDRHFAAMPRLRAVFYAAGNVKAFATPLVERGIVLVSAWETNAIPVAEMCLSQILLSLRGYFRSVRRYRELRTHEAKGFPRPGVNGATVGMLGMGKIGTRLTALLRDYPLRVIAYDPFLTAGRAAALGVEPVGLEEAFRRAAVVCNHIPDLPDTRGMLRGEHFRAMPDGATFVNTGRGAQVVEDDLLAVLRERPDLTALVDVTWPEPPAPGSPLWDLPNLVISPHIGGTIGDEVVRLADTAIEEYEAWAAGRPLRHRVTAEVLATMG